MKSVYDTRCFNDLATAALKQVNRCREELKVEQQRINEAKAEFDKLPWYKQVFADKPWLDEWPLYGEYYRLNYAEKLCERIEKSLNAEKIILEEDEVVWLFGDSE